MPIRPEMRCRYPADWKRIRSVIRTRAGDHCEWCGVPNGKVIQRHSVFIAQFIDIEKECPHNLADGWRKPVRIVCTTAHIYDRNPENCEAENLAFLCQLCHNRHDAADRAKNRKNNQHKEAQR